MPDRGRAQPTVRPAAGRIVVAPFDTAARRIADACASALVAAGHLVTRAETAAGLIEEMALSDQEAAVIALTSEDGARLAEPGEGARRLLETIGRHRETALVILCAVPEGPSSRAAIRSGAFATAAGAEPPGPLLDAVDRTLRIARALQREARTDPGEADLERLIGVGGDGDATWRLVRRAAETITPVLVIGEAGSGKHLVARAIHARARGRRRSGPFVKLPVGALAGLPPQAIREEICGTAIRPGPLELADGGTLFLDDIDRLPLELQTVLVELLDEGAAARVPLADGSGVAPADVRLIAGAPEDLEQAHGRGALRTDLYYRLKVLPIQLVPLRERLSDLPGLADELIRRYSPQRRPGGRAIVGLTPRAVALLQSHAWPGNLRELEDHIRRAVRRTEGPTIDEEDLPELASMIGARAKRTPLGALEIHLALDEALPLAEVGRRAAAAAEIAAIRRALRISGGNVTHAARALEVSRIHLQKRMKRYGLREIS